MRTIVTVMIIVAIGWIVLNRDKYIHVGESAYCEKWRAMIASDEYSISYAEREKAVQEGCL
jgi:hypothetical protein